MKKKIISWLIVISMLVPLCFTVYAADISTYSLESEVSDHIEQMVSQFYSNHLGQYEIGNAVTIYNADTTCVYYILPIFCNQECIGTVELDTTGNVSLTNEVALYTEITELMSPRYLLYTSGGVVYAELPGEVVELYDSGFDIPLNSNFTLLPYEDKVEEAKIYSETATALLDIAAVVAQTELGNTVVPEVSPLAEVPAFEAEQCSITNFVRQGYYNICWAACVATIANYKKGLSLTAETVALSMGHNYTAEHYSGASATETARALAPYNLSYNTTSAKLSWGNVKNNIINDCPFIVGLTTQYYDSDLGRTVTRGHMLTGYGYDCKYGDAEANANMRYVHVWDPNGTQRYLQYHASSYSINGYAWTWAETIVD